MGYSRTLLSLVFLASSLHGQEAVPRARTILELSDGEQAAFVRRTMELGFPDDRSDQMTMLIINRSALTLPLIEAKVEQVLKAVSPNNAFVEIASEMIAYAGDEMALKQVSRLVALDENRFGPLVGRTLNNAENWRNPFTVAYRGLDIGNEVLSRKLVAWVETSLASNTLRRAWAEAMLDRYGKIPGDSEWLTDSIVSRLDDRTASELRRSITGFAADAHAKRKR